MSFDNSFDNIPRELREIDRWVCWKTEVRDNKPTKVLKISWSGKNAMSNKPETQGSFSTALEGYEKHSFDGIGFVFNGDGIIGIDIDGCRDLDTGQLNSVAKDIISTMGSYTEISPSGKGMHIIFRADFTHDKKETHYEPGKHLAIYTSKYFTMTGNILDDGHADIEERTAELEVVYEKYINVQKTSKNTNEKPNFINETASFVTEAEVFDRIKKSKKRDHILGLLNGVYDKLRYPSPSEAELGLMNELAFLSDRNSALMWNMFSTAGIFRPDEFKRNPKKYDTTLRKAINDCRECYSERRERVNAEWESRSRKKHEQHEQQEPPDIDTGFEQLIKESDHGLPKIITTNRDLGELSDEVLETLKSSNNPPVLFVRAGTLVRLDRAKDRDDKERPIIKSISESALRGRMARVARYQKVTKDTKKDGIEYSATSPPLDTVRDILALPEDIWPFPYLTGITQIPIFRKDGTIFSAPGYDKESCLYYLPESRLDISLDIKTEEAINLLQEIFCDFPFDKEESRANCLGLLLTLVLRELIDGPVPLAIIDKPQQGTGASLLANVNSLIATGSSAFMETFPTGRDKENELRKRITSILIEGRTQIVLDNIENTFQSAVLAALLTSVSWQDRALGENKLVTLPHRTVWMATGNNVIPAGDIPRRCYTIKLDAKQARPWQRTGFKHSNLLKWVGENRNKILSAIFKLAQNWIYAGRPLPANLPVLGNFDEWAQTIGGILHHAGIKGFLGNLEEMYKKSEEDEGWEEFFAAWYELFGEKQFTLKEIAYALLNNAVFAQALPEYLDANDKSFTRQLGNTFKKKDGRKFANNLTLERGIKIHHTLKWKVTKKGGLGVLGDVVPYPAEEEGKQENIYTHIRAAHHPPEPLDPPNNSDDDLPDFDDEDKYARPFM